MWPACFVSKSMLCYGMLAGKVLRKLFKAIDVYFNIIDVTSIRFTNLYEGPWTGNFPQRPQRNMEHFSKCLKNMNSEIRFKLTCILKGPLKRSLKRNTCACISTDMVLLFHSRLYQQLRWDSRIPRCWFYMQICIVKRCMSFLFGWVCQCQWVVVWR